MVSEVYRSVQESPVSVKVQPMVRGILEISYVNLQKYEGITLGFGGFAKLLVRPRH